MREKTSAENQERERVTPGSAESTSAKTIKSSGPVMVKFKSVASILKTHIAASILDR
jgi:hypothetical protein